MLHGKDKQKWDDITKRLETDRSLRRVGRGFVTSTKGGPFARVWGRFRAAGFWGKLAAIIGLIGAVCGVIILFGSLGSCGPNHAASIDPAPTPSFIFHQPSPSSTPLRYSHGG